MPLTSIDNAKDLAVTYKPLVLASITFADSSILRVSTDPLNAAEGGYQYGGNDYLGRILSHNFGTLNGYHASGIDIVPDISITLADADKFVYSNYHVAKGFKGAAMALRFVLWDVGTSTFSSDYIEYSYTCEQASVDDIGTLTIRATNDLNLQRRFLPPAMIQRRCPKINPTTSVARSAAANADSIYYPCGETRDLTTAPPCSYTRESCTQPNRFAGITYDVLPGNRSREYTSGSWIDIKNAPTKSKYGKSIPLVYGTAWVAGAVANVFGDGNSTRGEAIFCWGDISQILTVVVNDRVLPAANDMSGGTNYIVQDALLRYNVINRGDRDGSPNADVPYSGAGDPYGSIAAIMWVVPRGVAESSSEPSVRALIRGKQDIRIYSGANTYSVAYTENPVWVLMDLLKQCGYEYTDFSRQSWVDAAATCDATISYTDQYGNSATRPRFTASLVVDGRSSAADVIRRFRRSAGLFLYQNPVDGKIAVFVQGTLASQQPSAVAGSNYNSPVSSKSLAGTAMNGYYAYAFDRVIAGTLREVAATKDQQPNKVNIQCINSERDFVSDLFSVIDPPAVDLAGGVVEENAEIVGINHPNQASRLARRMLAEANYGNSRGDAGGTQIWEFEHPFGSVRVRAGQICRLSDTHHGISNVPVRVLQVRPATNWATAKFTVMRHNDDWYLDSLGNTRDGLTRTTHRDRLDRAAYPWCPDQQAPITSDAVFAESDKTFALSEVHEFAADGSSIAKLKIAGKYPVNLFSTLSPPAVSRQGTTANTGGSLAGGGWVYYIAVSARGADGKLTVPSIVAEIPITGAGSSHTATVSVSGWPSGASGYVLFAGRSPHLLTAQASATGTPATITLSAFNERSWGQPDVEFDRLLVKVKRIYSAGARVVRLSDVSTNTFTRIGAGWTTNEWANRIASVVAIDGGDTPVPIENYAISANSATSLTVSPDPLAAGIGPSDVIVIRNRLTAVSSNYVEDSKWGLTSGAHAGQLLRILAGPGRGDVYRIASNTSTRVTIEGTWTTTPTTSSFFCIEQADWAFSETTDSLNSADETSVLTLEKHIGNFSNQALLVAVYAIDGAGNESFDALTPVREIYYYGSKAAPGYDASRPGYYEVNASAMTTGPDLANGYQQEILLDQNLTLAAPMYTDGTLESGHKLVLILLQDATGGRQVTFHADYLLPDGFTIVPTANTQTIIKLVRQPDGKWLTENFPSTGVAS